MPPEVYGALSLAAAHAKRMRTEWKPSIYLRREFRRKCQRKIDRLLNRAARLLNRRGLSVDDVIPQNQGCGG